MGLKEPKKRPIVVADIVQKYFKDYMRSRSGNKLQATSLGQRLKNVQLEA
jgi:hypothetical protein